MLKSLPAVAAVFTLGIIILIAFAVLVIKSRRRLSVTWKVGGVPAKSTCCHAPTQPLGWTADGWVAMCKACGAWQYLGDDFDNPPPGFQQRDAAVNSKPYAGSDDEVIPFKGYARGGLVDPSGPRTVVGERPSEYPATRLLRQSAGQIAEVTSEYQFKQSGDICRMLNCDEPIHRLGLCQYHWDWLNAQERLEEDEGEPLTSPPMPNVGGEGHPDYQGPHYESSHEQPTRFVPYDMLNEPIPGTGVVRVGKVACVGPFPIEGQGDEDSSADKS